MGLLLMYAFFPLNTNDAHTRNRRRRILSLFSSLVVSPFPFFTYVRPSFSIIYIFDWLSLVCLCACVTIGV